MTKDYEIRFGDQVVVKRGDEKMFRNSGGLNRGDEKCFGHHMVNEIVMKNILAIRLS
jgi:hypothetical protein